MSNPKVFEYAKEIGMTPLALMDKIREWHLPVKSHMAELEPEVLAQLKAKLKGGSTEDAKPKETVKKVTRAKKAAPVAKKEKEEVEEPKTSKKSVVRRKVKDEEEEKPLAAAAPEAEEAQEEETSAKDKVVRRKAKAEEVEVPVVEEEIEKVEPPVVAKEVEAPVVPAPKVATPAETPHVARKKEVVVGQSGLSSSQTPVLNAKRNIVGRMDLSRVNPPPGQQRSGGGGGYDPSRAPRPQGGPGGGQGMNAPRTGNRNIRAGFVAQPTMPNYIEEVDDSSRRSKFEDRFKKNKAVVTAAPAEKVVDPENPEEVQFNAAEFRKREMVFQPKKKKNMLNRQSLQTQITTPKAHKRVLKVNNTMKVSDIAQEIGVKAGDLTKTLMKNGVMATMNTDLDFDTISLVVSELGWEAQNVYRTANEVVEVGAYGDLNAEPILRPPVVTVMGHVDHGKTSLLDSIRKANVAAGEAGGITQHIGAYNVKFDEGHTITFLDTPGHEAFTAMRARGANVTDIAIIVVAADDGVMPQTAEAINHAKAAGVPIIVAVNKIDKPGANIDRIKQQMTEYELVPEEWGGTTIYCPVSAIQKTGIKELLEQITLVAEIEELKANPKRSGTGIIIESRLEKGRGPVVTLLVQDGTVKVGQDIVAGNVVGRVRGLMNDKGERIMEIGPGMPAEMIGLSSTPSAGDRFDVVKDEKAAEKVAALRKEQEQKTTSNPNSKMSLEELFSKVNQGDVKELPIILKTDVMGSLEAIQGMFQKVSAPEVKIKVIHAAVGGVTENDVLLAKTSKGIIIGFNVRPDTGAQNTAKRDGIEIRTYSIVYELIDDIKKAMTGLLTPDVVEKVMGRAEVRNTFTVPKIGTIAGCSVVDGKIMRSNLVRLVRDGRVIYEGKIGSLKRFKDDAKEVATGYECGIGIENFNDVKVGDVIEAYVKEEIARELSNASPAAEA